MCVLYNCISYEACVSVQSRQVVNERCLHLQDEKRRRVDCAANNEEADLPVLILITTPRRHGYSGSRSAGCAYGGHSDPTIGYNQGGLCGGDAADV